MSTNNNNKQHHHRRHSSNKKKRTVTHSVYKRTEIFPFFSVSTVKIQHSNRLEIIYITFAVAFFHRCLLLYAFKSHSSKCTRIYVHAYFELCVRVWMCVFIHKWICMCEWIEIIKSLNMISNITLMFLTLIVTLASACKIFHASFIRYRCMPCKIICSSNLSNKHLHFSLTRTSKHTTHREKQRKNISAHVIVRICRYMETKNDYREHGRYNCIALGI